MKITVSWIKDAGNKGEETFNVSDKAGFELIGGMLIVKEPEGPIAVYAAGCWSQAKRMADDGSVPKKAVETGPSSVTNPDREQQ